MTKVAWIEIMTHFNEFNSLQEFTCYKGETLKWQNYHMTFKVIKCAM